jgi:hypothetical protein
MHSLSDVFFYVFYFLNEHRVATVILTGLSFWAFAYTWYFGKLIRGVLRRGQPHNWRVDQVNKIGYTHGVRDTQ